MNKKTPGSESFYRKFIQIPGPNPILSPGEKDAWDEHLIECGDVFKDQYTYYLYYHGSAKNRRLWPARNPGLSYRIGVATAPTPLGPWVKYGRNPIVDLGADDSWENMHVACPHIVKEKENTYNMWYSAWSDKGKKWNIGLATASNPLGPWTKYKKNPVLKDFGYVGSVLKVNDKYLMYAEHPVGGCSPDQGPICLAVADRPEGPWRKYKNNPVLAPDNWGSWDDGGYSESKVVYHDGMFHMFYAGTKWKKLERIGYAHSRDGCNFTKYPGNPIALTERCPPANAFAEVHALFEPPLIYLYHTLRFKDVDFDREDIGV